MIDAPTSWGQVLECRCGACRELSHLYLRCMRAKEYLFVQDCRMFGRGYKVADVRRCFREPATEGPDFADVAAAADYVLARQTHCDAFVSSFPLRPEGCGDFAWRAKQITLGPDDV